MAGARKRDRIRVQKRSPVQELVPLAIADCIYADTIDALGGFDGAGVNMFNLKATAPR